MDSRFPVIVISLSQSRRDRLMQDLAKLKNLDVHVLAGFDGRIDRTKDHLVNQKAFQHINKRLMLPGEIGCAISHHMAYLFASENMWDWALILEDNIRVNTSSAIELSNLAEWLTLSKQLQDEPTLIHLLPHESTLVGRSLANVSSIELFESLSILRLAKGYLINRRCLELAATRTLPITDVADWPHWITQVKLLVTYRDLISIDRSLESEIGFRPQQEFEQISNPFLRRMYRAKSFTKMIFGIEYLEYRLNTGRGDYFQWIVIDRIARYLYTYFSTPNLLNQNFREGPLLVTKQLFALRKGRQF